MTNKQIFIPPVIWAQRCTVVYVTICVEYRHNERTKIDIQPEQIVFHCFAGLKQEKEYAITIPLFGTIVPEVCEIKLGRYVELILQKPPNDINYWSRLTKEKQKYHWLKVNFEKWNDEENSDDQGNSDDEDNSDNEDNPDDGDNSDGEDISDYEAVNEDSISMIGDTHMDDVLCSKIKGEPNINDMLNKMKEDTTIENIDDMLRGKIHGAGEPGESMCGDLIGDLNEPLDQLVVIENETAAKEEDLLILDEVKLPTTA